MARRAWSGYSLVLLTVFGCLLLDLGCEKRPKQVEAGQFVVYGWGRPWGRETYTIRRSAGELRLHAEAGFQPGGAVQPSLHAELVSDRRWNPKRFRLRGELFQYPRTEVEVLFSGSQAVVQRAGIKEIRRVEGPLFPLVGDAPVSISMILLRRWRNSQGPVEVELVPAGKAWIEPRGRDVIDVGNERRVLERYSVGGITWGRQTMWVDLQGRLIAAVACRDPWTLLVTVRKEYDEARERFLELAAEDGLERVVKLAAKLRNPASRKVAIRAALLIDGTGARPVPDAVVVIDGDRIVAAGPASQIAVPAGASLFELPGGTILPGLWDMHVHLRQPELVLAYLAAGVTTIRDVLNNFAWLRVLRKRLYEASWAGPRLLVAGVIDGPGALAVEPQVSSPSDLARVLYEYRAAGFEQVKVYNSLPHELLPAVVRQAHSLGMTVTGHVPSGLALEQALKAGIDGIEHLYFVAPAARARPGPLGSILEDALAVDLRAPASQSIIRELARRRVVVTPTLVLNELLFGGAGKPLEELEPHVRTAPASLVAALEQRRWKFDDPKQVQRAQRAFRNSLGLAGELHRQGVLLLGGTDRGLPGWALHRELELLVAAGLSPMEAIRAATQWPAQVMGLGHCCGTIAPGKQADVIVIEGNPLRDIRTVRNVRWVIRAGAVYEASKLWEVFCRYR